METPLLSVIVPVYNTEKFLERCIESILFQTYSNLEIIIVDDGSTDNSFTEIEKYKLQDKRIKLVRHEKNLGLYKARLSGFEASAGEYIAFVDSDDYISVDWFRLLIKKALEESSDITIGKVVHENSDGFQYVHSAYHDYDFGVLCNDEILSEYLKQEGHNFLWHAVWNKIYSREIFAKCMRHYTKMTEHLIMAEDIVFSSVLFYYAKKLSCTDYGYYFYFQHENSATGLHCSAEKIEKYIIDLGRVFDFTTKFFIEKKLSKEQQNSFKGWKELYSRYWYDNIRNAAISTKEKTGLLSKLKSALHCGKLTASVSSDHYFYRLTVKWDDRYQKLVETVATMDYQVLSLDVFDTMLLRPFEKPENLFEFLNSDFHSLYPECKGSFASLRCMAEEQCRKYNQGGKEITLEDIYECLNKNFFIPKDISAIIKQKEIELEKRFCYARKSIKNLYELAISLGKKVICISDMYLSKDVIAEMLKKCGYNDIYRLYVSSGTGCSKQNGTLFKAVTESLNISRKDLFHIGDSWHSDKLMCDKIGISNHFYARTIECFWGWISDIYSGKAQAAFQSPQGERIDYQKALSFTGTNCMLGVVANKLFDNPYETSNPAADFNVSPKNIGYFAVGMHLFGLTKWFCNDLKKNNFGKLHFIARDGYLPKLCYDKFRLYDDTLPLSEYLHISRKAFLPCGIKSKSDFFDLSNQINIFTTSPHKLIKMLNPILKDNIKLRQGKSGLASDKKFKSLHEFNLYLKQLIEFAYDENKNADYRTELREYFTALIDKNDTTFDIGYSGRSQRILSDLLGFNIGGYYIHSNNDCCMQADKSIKCFYDFTPSITGAIRELILSENAPSCIKINPESKANSLEYEKKNTSYIEGYAISEIQKYAVEFVSDMLAIFEGYTDPLTFRNQEVSFAFEYFLHHANAVDRRIFDEVMLEDELYGGYERLSLNTLWERDILYHNIKQKQEQTRQSSYNELQELYHDGLFVKFYSRINKHFPKGSKKRELIKKIAAGFLKTI